MAKEFLKNAAVDIKCIFKSMECKKKNTGKKLDSLEGKNDSN